MHLRREGFRRPAVAPSPSQGLLTVGPAAWQVVADFDENGRRPAAFRPMNEDVAAAVRIRKRGRGSGETQEPAGRKGGKRGKKGMPRQKERRSAWNKRPNLGKRRPIKNVSWNRISEHRKGPPLDETERRIAQEAGNSRGRGRKKRRQAESWQSWDTTVEPDPCGPPRHCAQKPRVQKDLASVKPESRIIPLRNPYSKRARL